jgi:hypothetical protein
MPNVKLFVDDRVLGQVSDRLEAVLTEIRAFLCRAFGVTEPACHLVVVPVRSLAGQTPVNIELVILRRADRPRETVEDACGQLQALAVRLFAAHAAIRCTMQEAEGYVVKR